LNEEVIRQAEPNAFKSFFSIWLAGKNTTIGITPKGTEEIEHRGNREFDSLEKSLFTLSNTL